MATNFSVKFYTFSMASSDWYRNYTYYPSKVLTGKWIAIKLSGQPVKFSQASFDKSMLSEN